MFKAISFSLLNPRNSFLCILRAFRALSPTAVCPGPVDLSCLSSSLQAACQSFSGWACPLYPPPCLPTPSHHRGDTNPEVTGHFINPFGV